MSAELLMSLPDYLPSPINAMQDGFVLHCVDGTIIDVNDAFLNLVGLERADAVGMQPPHSWRPQKDRDTLDDTFDHYVQGQLSEDRLTYRTSGWTEFPVLVTSAPPRESEHRIIGFIDTTKDMTAWNAERLGLGLDVAHRIVGGCMWVQSEPGQGAQSSFSLPAEQPVSDAP